MIGQFLDFGTVWYYSDGIANVLSLGLVSSTMRVTMDTAIDNALYVHKDDGTLRRFGKSKHGLYYSRVNSQDGCMLTIITVKEKESQYSDLDVRRAKKAREARKGSRGGLVDPCRNQELLQHQWQLLKASWRRSRFQ